MVTRWYKILKSMRYIGNSSQTYPTNDVINYNNTTYTIPSNGYSYSSYPNYFTGSVRGDAYLSSAIPDNGQIGIYVGSGTTPATETDYNLETPITTLTRTSQTPGASAIVEDGYVIGATRSVTYQNNTEDDITVSEIGVFVRWTYGASSGFYSTFLIERTVLDTPITLANGETITVTFKMY